jgi:hypothetical protein
MDKLKSIPFSIYDYKTLGTINKCWYCGKVGKTNADHFYPKSKGGKLKVRSCVKCNTEKGCKTPLEWIAVLEDEARLYSWSIIQTQRLQRMIHAVSTLWNRVNHSLDSSIYISCNDDRCLHNINVVHICKNNSVNLVLKENSTTHRHCFNFVDKNKLDIFKLKNQLNNN